jgi:ribosomal subunit interface protein
MRIQIAARHCEVPEPVRARADEQLQRLTRYEPRLSAAEVVFEEEKHLKKVEGILSVDRDKPVVGSGEGESFRAALDQMLDRLSRMLRKRRSQRVDHQGPRNVGVNRAVAD